MSEHNVYLLIMVLKNILLVISGGLGVLIVLFFYIAYYITNSMVNEEIEENIVFHDVPKAKLLWKQPKDFLQALEMVYAIAFWHLTNTKKATLQHSLKRGRRILVTVLILFLVLLIATVVLSVDITLPPPPPK